MLRSNVICHLECVRHRGRERDEESRISNGLEKERNILLFKIKNDTFFLY